MSDMQSPEGVIVVLGTGGTIAGRADAATDHTGYRAGELGVHELLGGVSLPHSVRVESEQVAQLDSKDMDFVTWQRLEARIASHLARPDVRGVVITHGTDTLEETAWFLHRTVQATRPVVLTAAMRPATALSPDGPQNLADALLVAASPHACGVMAVLQGRIHAGCDLRKLHGYRVDAFSSGDAGALALVEEGRVRCFRPWPTPALHPAWKAGRGARGWPWVEVVFSAAGAQARAIDALVEAGVQGLVVAGTGNGTVHRAWDEALSRAQARGVVVRRASRCGLGGVVGTGEGAGVPTAGPLSVPQARVELILDLLPTKG